MAFAFVNGILDMESIIKLRKLNMKHVPGSSVDLSINEGEIVALMGANGSGKSTLAKYIAGLLRPDETDKVVVRGLDTAFPANIANLHRRCGIVLQNPEDNYIFDELDNDVMFGPENLNVPAERIVKKTDKILKAAGLFRKRKKNPAILSGGEKQRGALAAILAMQPEILVLDEPFSMQSEKAADHMLSFIITNAKERNQTVLLITQDRRIAEQCDRIVFLEKGQIIDEEEYSGESAGEKSENYFGEISNGQAGELSGEYAERKIKKAKASGLRGRIKKNFALRSKTAVNEELKGFNILDFVPNKPGVEKAEGGIILDNVSFSYGKQQVLQNISYTFGKGHFYMIKGGSGCGKTTLTMLLNGLLAASQGTVTVEGNILPDEQSRRARKGIRIKRETFDINKIRRMVGYVSQIPEKMLFADSILEDTMFGALNLGYDKEKAGKAAAKALTDIGLKGELWSRRVGDLSGGEKRRAGIAGILAFSPEYLILDESDAGLDEEGVSALMDVIKSYTAEGKTVIFVTH